MTNHKLHEFWPQDDKNARTQNKWSKVRMSSLLHGQGQNKPVTAEESTGVFDKDSPIFKDILYYSGIIIGVALLIGSAWELIYRQKQKSKNQVQTQGSVFVEWIHMEEVLSVRIGNARHEFVAKIIIVIII